MNFDMLWLPSLIVYLILAKIGIKIDVIIGTFLYGVILVILRLIRAVIKASRKAVGLYRANPVIKIPEIATRAIDINSCHRLKDLEVILGYRNNHGIRVDLDRYHTLIASVSGGGKTNLIHQILIQLTTRPGHNNKFEIHLLDLKSDPRDRLNKWVGIIAGYHGIDENGSTQKAIEAIEAILANMQNNPKRQVVIIDELAMLTDQAPNSDLKRRGEAALRRLSSQLRISGALVVATQRPHYTTISRNVSANLERKVCLRVDDVETAKLILRADSKQAVDKRILQFTEGEFFLKEPPRVEKIGRSLLVTPEEIDMATFSAIAENGEQDPRIKLFHHIASTLQPGSRVAGINAIAKEYPGLHSKEIEACYRNYVACNALKPILDKSGKSKGNVLVEIFPVALKLVKDRIANGEWQESPPPIRKEPK